MSKKREEAHVVMDLDKPISIIASHVEQMAAAFQKISDGPIQKRVLILLLHDAIGVSRISKSQIEDVLDTLPKLKNIYLKPVKAENKSTKES